MIAPGPATKKDRKKIGLFVVVSHNEENTLLPDLAIIIFSKKILRTAVCCSTRYVMPLAGYTNAVVWRWRQAVDPVFLRQFS